MASATPTCASGSLSALIVTTCDIGSLRFTFDGLYSGNSSGTTWTASDFTFAPVSNGFSLSFIGVPQSITSASDGRAEDYAYLLYSVSDLAGNFTGESATGGSLSASAGGDFGEAIYEGYTFNATSQVYGYKEAFNGVTYEFQNQLLGAPFSDGTYAYAYPFSLAADSGGSASWDGSTTTFTYDTVATLAPIPEPSSLLLFGTGLLGIVFITRKKLAQYNNR